MSNIPHDHTTVWILDDDCLGSFKNIYYYCYHCGNRSEKPEKICPACKWEMIGIYDKRKQLN